MCQRDRRAIFAPKLTSEIFKHQIQLPLIRKLRVRDVKIFMKFFRPPNERESESSWIIKAHFSIIFSIVQKWFEVLPRVYELALGIDRCGIFCVPEMSEIPAHNTVSKREREWEKQSTNISQTRLIFQISEVKSCFVYEDWRACCAKNFRRSTTGRAFSFQERGRSFTSIHLITVHEFW